MTPRAILEFLSDPRSYDHRPDAVEIVQTHASIVALAGPLVFKVRKPVNFGFLDYSTLDRRRHFSFREVQLNRRLCPDVYLGVVPIVNRAGRLCFADPCRELEVQESGELPEEYAVKMTRLDERFFLSSLLSPPQAVTFNVHALPDSVRDSDSDDQAAPRDCSVGSHYIQRIVETLVPFYDAQPSTPGFGTLACVREAVIGNLDLCEKAIGPVLACSTLNALRSYAELFIGARATVLNKRVDAQRIRDCHGDLRPMHIHLGPNSVSIYDCIEFNDNLRCIDVAADIAFLGMELAYAGRWDLSEEFFARMMNRLEDPGMNEVLDFYLSYRAAVRGKVAWLLAGESEMLEEKRPAILEEAGNYFRLALRHALFGSKSMMICVMGRVGTGKSTLAQALGRVFNWPIISTDFIRKKLAGVPSYVRVDPEERKQLYSQAMSDRTYASMIESGLDALGACRGAVLDATFGRLADREALMNAVWSRSGEVFFIELTAIPAVIRERLAERERRLDIVSDARLEDIDHLYARYQPPDELSSDVIVRHDGSRPIDSIINELLVGLAERHVRLG